MAEEIDRNSPYTEIAIKPASAKTIPARDFF
jgi:hypothetical protein